MKQKQGIQTGLFGEWLSNYLHHKPKYAQYTVYYDHGDKKKNHNVVSIKGILGGKLCRQNTLAEVDVMVTSPNNEIITIIEIEERPSTPKKIIGDIMTLALCNRFYIKQNGEPQDFKITHDTRLVVAGITPPEGSKLPQLCNIIPRLKRFTSPDDGINLQNLNYIFREDINTTLEALKKYMQEIFP